MSDVRKFVEQEKTNKKSATKGGRGSEHRVVLRGVVHSIVLYEVPLWCTALRKQMYTTILDKPRRRFKPREDTVDERVHKYTILCHRQNTQMSRKNIILFNNNKSGTHGTIGRLIIWLNICYKERNSAKWYVLWWTGL